MRMVSMGLMKMKPERMREEETTMTTARLAMK